MIPFILRKVQVLPETSFESKLAQIMFGVTPNFWSNLWNIDVS